MIVEAAKVSFRLILKFTAAKCITVGYEWDKTKKTCFYSRTKRKLYLLWVRFGKQLEIAYVCGKVLGRLIANFDSGPENSQSILPFGEAGGYPPA